MKKRSLISLLKNREYILLQIGIFISRSGTFMQDVAVNWQLYQLTKSPLSLGILGLAKFIPVLIFSMISGMAADVFNRKKIIFLVQIFSIFNALALAILTITGRITPLLIYILVGMEAGLYSFETPSRQSMLPNLVGKEDFPLAVNINNILFNSTNFIGPAISGFIIAISGVQTVYLINAFSFLAVLIALILMKPLTKNFEKQPSFNFRGIKEGIDFVFKTPLIYGSMFIDFVATFFASATTLMPIFAVDILKVGPKELGFLYAAPSIGAIIAGIIFPFMNKFKSKGKLLILSVCFYGLNIILFSISRNFYLSLIFIGLSGAGDMISAVIRNVIRQMNTSDDLRGRMTAVNMVFYTGGPQLGETEAGLAASFMGTPLSVAFGGMATILATIYIAVKTPELFNYRDRI
ncbi:MFS transporter [Candidatus Roizmanbacteria bacterium CG06_land_8_20_14_3_00_34_14]|uniref:MFS transporter n=1 Tax=Candidatus Roizmanbacteria bacterium CG06_land_8_20_14_3_00_34_14 TaxID=1974848 RepID=A0A2M7AU17_9BACT|nr:MAG: MFS transporter [Candidatus Roizmanbacteria bacterium CG06_land_8_20_14_3_00_34_14]